MLNLTYEYKLIPTDAQRETFDQWLDICRKVYNFALRERKDWVNSRKCDINSCSISKNTLFLLMRRDQPLLVNAKHWQRQRSQFQN